MKKTFIFGLIAAALGFTACSSEDDLMVNNQNTHKGMVLRATVEQPAETRATFTDNEGVWQFDFATGDNVSVTNNDMTPDFYTFTNEGTEFKCEDAKAAEGPVAWYAYFPSNEIDLANQSGTKEDVANLYALAGATTSATTGEGGLSITMSPQVAILVINNQKGAIDISLTTAEIIDMGIMGPMTMPFKIQGLKANGAGFDLNHGTNDTKFLSKTEKGTYYIAVPAGVQFVVKDGDTAIKSTGTSGLQAGKYYNLTIAPATTGTAEATIGENNVDVKWIQLWKDGPKFAEYNYGAANNKPEDYGTLKNGNTAADKDKVSALWGSNWRLPTPEEYEALIDNCTCTWTTIEEVNGYKITGKGTYSSNSIFLPAAGYIAARLNSQGGEGHYWTSSGASSLWFYNLGSPNVGIEMYFDRSSSYKQSFRFVLAE